MFNDYLIQGGVLFLLGSLFAWWAHQNRFFQNLHNPDFKPHNTHPAYKKVRWYHVIAAFFALLFVQIVLLGYALQIFKEPSAIGWSVVAVQLILTLILAFCIWLSDLQSIVYKNKTYIRAGVLTLFLALPWVFFTGTVGRFIVTELLNYPPVEQNPITFLQSFSLDMPVFYAVAVSIFTIIPINEEIVFRGFFQNFATKLTGSLGGMILTPLFFTFVHYQPGQGYSNIELLAPLFILSVFLSYLYYKTGSLLSCIFFHGTFNFFSIVALTLEKLGLVQA